MVLPEDGLSQWLGEHVGWLISGADGVQGDFSMVNVVPEVMELDIDVLGPWAHLRTFGDFKGAAVVFKDATVDCWLGGDHVVALTLELFDKLHDWNCCAECSRQTYELTLCGA